MRLLYNWLKKTLGVYVYLSTFEVVWKRKGRKKKKGRGDWEREEEGKEGEGERMGKKETASKRMLP